MSKEIKLNKTEIMKKIDVLMPVQEAYLTVLKNKAEYFSEKEIDVIELCYEKDGEEEIYITLTKSSAFELKEQINKLLIEEEL